MKQMTLMAAAAFVFVFSFPLSGSAAELKEILLFKATAETENGEYYHWEYNSPDDYEYHVKGRALHGKEARKHVEKIYEKAEITAESSKEELAEAFQKTEAAPITRLDVRWQNGDGELYTWLWKKNR